jgi:pimeloyl-ACP methyl ester carboxylesterase
MAWIVSALAGGVGGVEDGDAEARARMDPLSRGLLFPREYEVTDLEYARLLPDTVHFENAQGAQLRGLWYESGDSDDTVIVCMGNTGNASWMTPHAAILHDAGFDVLLFDYQGFGPSEGVASLLSLPGDALAAWNFVTAEKGRKPEQIGVLGISLGSVLAMQLAAEQQPRACAVEDLFFPDRQLEGFAGEAASATEKMALAGLKALVLPKIDPRVNAKKFHGPLFLMHGDLDWLLTPMATVELAELRPENRRVWILAQTGHSPDSLQIDEWEYRDQLAGFFRDAFAAGAGGRGNSNRALQEPSAKCEPAAGEGRLRVTVTSAAAGPVQITLVGTGEKGEPRFQHEHRFVDEGETTFECAVPFVPQHALATRMTHAIARGDGTFGPELSPLSRSFVDFHDYVMAISQVPPDAKYRRDLPGAKEGVAPDRKGFTVRSAAQWPVVKRLIPDAGSIHPRVRPRLAIYVARLSFDFEWAMQVEGSYEAAVAAAEAMLPFLPPDPANFVTLGNASIDVGFRNELVERALLLLWHERARNNDVAGAQQAWRELVKYLPAAAASAR